MLSLVSPDAPVLHQVADRVTVFDRDLGNLIGHLFSRMLTDGWTALSAPHLGYPLRVVAYCVDGHQGYVVNPVIEHVDGNLMAEDICPSIDADNGIHIARRPLSIVISGVDVENHPTIVRAEGLGAHALHHELGHLDGNAHPQQRIDGS